MTDRAALRQGVIDGVIDAICSDHQPQDIDAKLAPFQEASPGISALETLLPLTMDLVTNGEFDLGTAISRLTANPAGIINKQAGTLAIGDTADLIVYNPETKWQLTPKTISSNGKNTPFMYREFTGKVEQTYVSGQRADTHP